MRSTRETSRGSCRQDLQEIWGKIKEELRHSCEVSLADFLQKNGFGQKPDQQPHRLTRIVSFCSPCIMVTPHRSRGGGAPRHSPLETTADYPRLGLLRRCASSRRSGIPRSLVLSPFTVQPEGSSGHAFDACIARVFSAAGIRLRELVGLPAGQSAASALAQKAPRQRESTRSIGLAGARSIL